MEASPALDRWLGATAKDRFHHSQLCASWIIKLLRTGLLLNHKNEIQKSYLPVRGEHEVKSAWGRGVFAITVRAGKNERSESFKKGP